jgi:hypothetical protein
MREGTMLPLTPSGGSLTRSVRRAEAAEMMGALLVGDER